MMRVLTIAISLTLGIAAGAIAGGQVTACQMDVQTGAGLNLADAAAGGGQVTFACPPGTVIRITRTHHLSVFTDVDGAGRVTLDAGDVTALFSASASADRIILRNIELRDGPSGFGFAGAGTSFGGLFFGPVTLELVKVTATLSRFPFVASAIRVSDSVFADNSGTVLRAPSIEIDGSRFSGNAGAPISPLLRGFGEGLEQGSAKIERTEFTSNGPIVWEGDISMRKATFAANASADRPGGALSALGTVEIANSRFVNNRAPDGGAIWFRGGSLTIRASTFEGNVADDKGGAIGVADDAPRSQIALRFIHFRANRARNGGAILLQSEPPGPGHTLTGSGINFAGNSASGSGGAIFALSGRIALERVLFLDNRAADSGGGILTSEFSDGVSLANAILARNQAPNGQIPKFVRPDNGEADFWYTGCIDATLWWLIAERLMEQAAGSREASEPSGAVTQALQWLSCQEHQGLRLIQQNEASDWADIMPRAGFVLYSNALWYWVKKLYSLPDAGITRDNANLLLFPFGNAVPENRRLRLMMHYVRNKARRTPFYLSFVNFSTWGEEVDTFGNILAALTGLADTSRACKIAEAIIAGGISTPYPVRVVGTPLDESSPLWRPYMGRHRQNLPWRYHNGGIWPFRRRILVILLQSWVKRGRRGRARRVALANRINDWEFNEWLHGQTAEPLGMPGQSWNAAVYVLAYQYLCNNDHSLI